ncbi:MAG: 4Fe-4S binding protein [Planctomycetota bacterium]
MLAREPGVSREEAEAARPSEPRDDPGMLMIDPDECIGCGACETECPVAAIHEIEALSPEDEGWAWANRFLTQALSPAARDAQRCRR